MVLSSGISTDRYEWTNLAGQSDYATKP